MPQFRLRVNPLAPSKSGYFILSFKTEKIKVVNADSAEISLLNQIIRRHTRIRSEGWERHMTWAFHLGESSQNKKFHSARGRPQLNHNNQRAALRIFAKKY